MQNNEPFDIKIRKPYIIAIMQKYYFKLKRLYRVYRCWGTI